MNLRIKLIWEMLEEFFGWVQFNKTDDFENAPSLG